MDQIPESIKQWYEKVVEESRKQAKKDYSETIIRRKLDHTLRVVKYGMKIMKREAINWNIKQGLTVCYLHDIGRFPQSRYGTFLDIKSIDHAQKGEEMFRASGIKTEEFGGNNKEIAEAIGQHNNPNYRGDNIYVMLVRDADQLAILEELEAQTVNIKCEFEISPKIRKEILDLYQGEEVINTRRVETLAEWFLALKSWERRFNFGATREIYQEEGMGRKILRRYQKEFPGEKVTAEYFYPAN